MPCKRVVTN